MTDYTHWHGMYEVAKHWYSEFIPELKEIAEHAIQSPEAAIAKGGKNLQKKIDEVLDRKEHGWFSGNLPKEEAEKRKKAQAEFKKRYGK